MQKTCNKCGATKPMADFYRHERMADGHLNACKECVKARVSGYRADNLARIQEYDRQRGLLPHRKAENSLRYRANKMDPAGLARIRGYSAKYNQKSPEKYKARNMVNAAIRDGKLTVKPCERCGYGIGVHAHHEDYSKPLDITWLCRPCHGARHREINEERRKMQAAG